LMKNRVARPGGAEEPDARVEAEIRLLREADRIVASTQAELAQFQWLYHSGTENVVVIPPGVDTSRFYPIAKDEARAFIGIPPDRKMVLFVGRMESLKGVDILLDAFWRLLVGDSMKESSACLALIGGDADVSPEMMDAEMTRLKALPVVRELGTKVRFLGKRDQDTLPYYYSSADVVVVPSEYESFGMVALEAMACGTPVVASETGGLAFLIRDGETGFHVPAGNPEALVERMGELLLNRELRQKLGYQASVYAKTFDWSLITDQILELYSTLVPRSA
jgi:D-inositol-3-phosphate glycosyltransferase